MINTACDKLCVFYNVGEYVLCMKCDLTANKYHEAVPCSYVWLAYAIINTKHILHITEKRRNMYLKYSDLFAAVEIAVGFA